MIFLGCSIYVYQEADNKNKANNGPLYLLIRPDRRQITIALPSVDWVESVTNILRAESISAAFERSEWLDCAVELLDELIYRY